MDAVAQIEQRRREVLEQMAAIRCLERATLSEQMLPVKHKGKKDPVLRGPYYVLARWENGKTRSRRVRTADLERVKREVSNHERFLALCEEFMDLTHRLGELEREQADARETLKKTPKSRLRKAGK